MWMIEILMKIKIGPRKFKKILIESLEIAMHVFQIPASKIETV